MISKQLLDLAAACLPKCKTLREAENHLGGVWNEQLMTRDYKAAAMTWGLFDAWHGRPMTDDFHERHLSSIYKEAYEAGRKLHHLHDQREGL